MLKFLCTYLNPIADPIFFFRCLETTKNNNIMFGFDDGNYLVKKQINNDLQPFQFKPKFIDGVSEEFYQKILKLILEAHEQAINLKTENTQESPDCSLQHDGELEGLIHSAMKGIQYQNYGVLDFVTHIVFRITTKQIWRNGNKRTAVVTASKLFNLFGLFLFFSNDNVFQLEHWRNFIKNTARKYENGKQYQIEDFEKNIIDDMKIKFAKNLHINLSYIF